MQEVKQGYPQHRWIAIGHMGEAADEALKKYPKLADEIRKHRLKYMSNADYDVPIMDLVKKASKLAGDLTEGSAAHSCGSVAVSLLKPGTKRYEKWLSLRNYRRKATMRKKQQEDIMSQEIMFWSEDHRPQDYENCILDVSEEKVTAVIEALQSGPVLESWRGWANCRICDENLGSQDLGGFGFKWPAQAEHYVMEHGVWTPGLEDLATAMLNQTGTLGEDHEEDRSGNTTCGIFIPIPFSLAKDFPNKDEHDTSVPHFTVLFVGDCTPESYKTLCKIVCRIARHVKPFHLNMSHYSEFMNKEKMKIAHMKPDLAGQFRLGALHGILRRAIEQSGAGINIKHTYDAGKAGKAPFEAQFKAHATLAYLPAAAAYRGAKPTGSWLVNEIECWGYEKLRIPLGHTHGDQPTGFVRDPRKIDYPMAVPEVAQEKKNILPSRTKLKIEDEIPGGVADDSSPSDFNSKQLAKGVKDELEHTNDPDIAREIAMDHLKKDPNYYSKLEKLSNLSKIHQLSKTHSEDVIGGSMGAVGKGVGGSSGDIGLEGSLPYQAVKKEIEKKLQRKKLAGI